MLLLSEVYHISLEISIGRGWRRVYSKFLELLAQKQVTPYQVSKATGISESTLSDWKHGKCKPKVDKLMKLADYFGVDVIYFLE